MDIQRCVTLLSPCQYFPLFLRVYSHGEGHVLRFTVVRLVTQGDLLLPLLGEDLAVAVPIHWINWKNGLSRLFHTAASLNQITRIPARLGWPRAVPDCVLGCQQRIALAAKMTDGGEPIFASRKAFTVLTALRRPYFLQNCVRSIFEIAFADFERSTQQDRFFMTDIGWMHPRTQRTLSGNWRNWPLGSGRPRRSCWHGCFGRRWRFL